MLYLPTRGCQHAVGSPDTVRTGASLVTVRAASILGCYRFCSRFSGHTRTFPGGEAGTDAR